MSLLTRASLKNRMVVGLLTLAIAVLGLFSMSSLKQELMPSMSNPMAFVSIQSQGLAPEEMVRLVTEPAEQAMTAVPGVTRVTSQTSSGSADVTIEWPFDENGDEILRGIRSAADSLKSVFPAAADVQVYSGGMDDVPAMMLSAGTTGDGAAFGEALAQQVVPALQGIAGVQKVELAGREEQRVLIAPRPADMDRLRVDPSQIAPTLEAHGAALPAGSAEGGDGEITVTVGSALASVEQISALPLSTVSSDGITGVVNLSDFADVSLEAVPTDTVSRVNGKPALTLQIFPAQGGNVVDISHAVNAELDRLAPGLKAEFVTLWDQAPYIEQSIHDLSVEGGLGLLFAVLVILAFLWSWRSTIIAALSIPLSLLITLIGLWWSDNTLNILTLGALTIAIGRVVDDSIVVIENISRRRGSGPLTVEGIVASVRQVAGAITASTLTTVAVFLPIAFVSGIAGQLFRPFAVTVTLALGASLLVALTIVPVLAYWFMNKRSDADRAEATASEAVSASEGARDPGQDARDPDPHDDLEEIHTPPPDRLQRALMPTLNFTRRHPVVTLISSALLLVLTLAMTPFLQTDLLGSSGAESLRLVQTPAPVSAEDQAEGDAAEDDAEADPNAEGVAAGDTERLIAAAAPVERALGEVPGVRDVMTSIPVGVSTGGPVQISYDVQLEDDADSATVGPAIEAALDGLPGAGEVRLETQDVYVGAAGDGIALQIRGNDPVALREASDLLEEQLKDAEGVRSVTSELTGEQPVVRVKLDEAKATRLGFDRALVASSVQEALEGKTVGRLMLEGREREIVLRTPGTERSVEQLGEILLPLTPQLTAQAQKRAADALQEKAEAEAEAQRMTANAELTNQINEAAAQRADLVTQIGQLSAQLAEMQAMPPVPVPPLSPEEEGAVLQAEQIAAIQGAIEGAQAGIAGIDEQIAALRQAQADAADQLAQQQAAEAEQKAAAEVEGTPVTLAEIATIEEELTAPTINRADGERQVALTVVPESGQLVAADLAVQLATQTTELPAGVSFEVGGASAEQDEAFAQLGAAMLGAILLVLLVMVATFRSFRGPFVLLVSIPFAATGAIIGLLVTNTALGLPALIGLLMLIGIVVTNAIVLMDFVNRLRASGATLDEAVEHGTRLRLRPILMTAAATIFALVPMSLGLTGGGVFISKPLAIVVIGGLISSTVLTLVLVPILYTLVERRREKKLRTREERRARVAERRAEWEARQAEQADAKDLLAQLDT